MAEELSRAKVELRKRCVQFLSATCKWLLVCWKHLKHSFLHAWLCLHPIIYIFQFGRARWSKRNSLWKKYAVILPVCINGCFSSIFSLLLKQCLQIYNVKSETPVARHNLRVLTGADEQNEKNWNSLNNFLNFLMEALQDNCCHQDSLSYRTRRWK